MALFLDFGEEQFAYVINDRTYWPFDLSPLNTPLTELFSGDLIPLEVLQRAQSQLITVGTEAGYLLIASSSPGNYQVLFSSESPEEIRDLMILDVTSFPIMIPDRPNLQPFHPNSLIRLQNAINHQTVGQVFGLNLPPTRSAIIDFPYVKQRLDQGFFVKWKLEPRFQSWVTPPNQMVTLIDRQGNEYLVRAKADLRTHMIYPPM